MKYINDKFLINNKVGYDLYHKYGKGLPIYDYHCHLSPKEIAEDKKYKNITELWLGTDHYKWRAMRLNGIEEDLITGDGDDYEKFLAFAKTLDQAIGNPLYQWSHLELSKYFGIDELLTEKSAPEIWKEANEKLKDISARTLLRDSNVSHVNTTDDPTDDLRYHKMIREDKTIEVVVNPTFRPDKAINIGASDFTSWLKKLEEVTNIKIDDIEKMEEALVDRVRYFDENNCKLADHGYSDFNFLEPNKEIANRALKKRINEEELSREEAIHYSSYILVSLCKEYTRLNWTSQFHIGAMRNNNTLMFKKLGPDTGFDSIGEYNFAYDLSRFLDYVYEKSILPKTILYTLNSKDNDILSTMMGNFPKENSPLHVVHGTAWWFYDQKDGIESQIKSFANLSLLGRYLGMVTDSRSFLSFTRHDYFRRVVCNLLGSWVEDNLIPNDEEKLKELVEKIFYYNALEYFKA